MFTAEFGWAFEPADGRVFQTRDGGRHWQDQTPPMAPSTSAAAANFLDQAHAWLIIPQPSHQNPALITATAWSTSDGGLTWRRGQDFSYVGDDLAGSLTFLDAQQGWFQANLGGGAGTWYSALFATADGGRHWSEVMTNKALPPATASPGSFPPCVLNGLTFVDLRLGWAAGDCFTTDLTLFATQDGGHTWQIQKLPLPAGIPSGAALSLWPPVFVSPRAGVVLAGGLPGAHSLLAYTTDDAGHTWQPHEMAATSLSPLGPPDFVDGGIGWFVGRSGVSGDQSLYVTHDGGRTWLGVKSATMPGSGIDFINSRHGWSWSPDGLLLETEDGGTTWHVLNPQLGNPRNDRADCGNAWSHS
jgi:photosystem II stability/assembly factor-like uncharacterized protein